MPSRTSREHIAGLLAELRRMFERKPRSPEDLAREAALYIDALDDLQPEHLAAAVRAWLRSGTRMPLPVDLRRLAEGEAERNRLDGRAQVTDQADLGATLRNEAINLLADFDLAARRHFGDGDGVTGAASQGYRNFLAEAAREWSQYRPEGGLLELDKQRGGRGREGQRLEDWARRRLGLDDPAAPLAMGSLTAAEAVEAAARGP